MFTIYSGFFYVCGRQLGAVDRTSDYLEHQYSRGKIKDDEDKNSISEKPTTQSGLLASIKAIAYLSEKLPNYKFVIRPHPDERHKTWHVAFAGHKNVDVIFEGVATDWIAVQRA